MTDFSFDERLFLWLNFDGGAILDSIMSAISGVVLWIPLYLYIAWTVLRKYGWKSMLAFLVCLALAMGIADMLCGIFKHTGMLKDLWADFPARNRPMFDVAVRDLAHVVSYAHGPYGTVSAHAATTAAMAILSALVLRKRWYSWAIAFIVLLISYSRIYLACHFPQDIALGLAVGLISGGAMYLLWRKLDNLLKNS
ncbi:MAG: phosphatase PAP2 family protein [Alistipes sp.]|nr:phosphatase PAP2 family protein [Alistipes sp.]MBQ9963169.1 phosphatase PAP2 family protein [Alistipes sp.]